MPGQNKSANDELSEAPVQEEAVYVALGDSITEGYGVAFGFVDGLAERLRSALPKIQWKVVNCGRSGETSVETLHRIGTDVLYHHPSLVTVNYGVNDAFSGISPDRFADALKSIVKTIRHGGCERIVLLSSGVIPDPVAERQVLPYWEAMRCAAAASGTVYADVNGFWRGALAAGRSERELIIPGDLHPNEAGHRVIADAVWEAVMEHRLLEGI